jgi:hypothetical protein
MSQAGAFSTTCSIRSKLTFGGRAREFLRKGERGARPLGVPLGTASRRAAIRSHGPVTAGNSGGMEIKLRRNRLKTLKRGGEKAGEFPTGGRPRRARRRRGLETRPSISTVVAGGIICPGGWCSRPLGYSR